MKKLRQGHPQVEDGGPARQAGPLP
jgi:hypothetical protein